MRLPIFSEQPLFTAMHLVRDGRATSVSESVTAGCRTADEETGAKRNPVDTALPNSILQKMQRQKSFDFKTDTFLCTDTLHIYSYRLLPKRRRSERNMFMKSRYNASAPIMDAFLNVSLPSA